MGSGSVSKQHGLGSYSSLRDAKHDSSAEGPKSNAVASSTHLIDNARMAGPPVSPLVSDFELETVGDQIHVRLSITPSDGWSGSSDDLGIRLSRHDEVAVQFWAAFSCRRERDQWVGELGAAREGEPRLAQLVGVATTENQQIPVQGEALRLEPGEDGVWDSGEAARRAEQDLRTKRDATFSAPLTTPGAREGATRYDVLMLADNLLSTVPQRVPGIQIIPLQNSTLGSDLIEVLNSVARQFGFAAGVDPGRALNLIRERRPSVILHAPVVVAESSKAALEESRRNALMLLDLVTLRRGAPPRLLGGMVGEQGNPASVRFWVEGSGYTGNLVGGFLSGEDPVSLLNQWRGIASDPRSRLWLSLYADALADGRWDYRIFRCFNLLEGIGGEVLRARQTVTDEAGQPLIQANGRPYTTSQARGKVFELMKLVAGRTNQALQNFAVGGATPARTPWDEVAVWVAIRNAVAHRGAWETSTGSTPSAADQRVAAEISSLGHDGSFVSGADASLRAIRVAVDSTLYAALRGKL